jgi:hypothetical protein
VENAMRGDTRPIKWAEELRESIEMAYLSRPENAAEAFRAGVADGRKRALIDISNHVARYARTQADGEAKHEA